MIFSIAMSLIISIDGNIGCGKSTFLKELKKEVKNQRLKNIIFLQEPVDQWSRINVNGVTILEKFYENPDKYAFSFQMMAYISRLSLFKKTIKENPDTIIVTERSLYTDKNIFAKMLYDDGKIDSYSYQIYNMWFDEFIKDLPEHKYLYLESSPNVIFNRIKKRDRIGENNIGIDYLGNCHNYHQEMFSDNRNLIAKINMDKYEFASEGYKNLVFKTVKIISNYRMNRHNEEMIIAYLSGISSLLIVGVIFYILNIIIFYLIK
jgi:deoxyadenosine/deoxycytidine kinase